MSITQNQMIIIGVVVGSIVIGLISMVIYRMTRSTTSSEPSEYEMTQPSIQSSTQPIMGGRRWKRFRRHRSRK